MDWFGYETWAPDVQRLAEISATRDMYRDDRAAMRFTDPEMTARLLEGVRYPNKGIMLDTGHLMHTNTALRTQKESLEYIHSMLDLHGELCHAVRGIHLNQSITGALMRRYMRNPPAMLPTYAQRNGQIFEYIFQIDVHRPFTCPGVGELIERIDPEDLVRAFDQLEERSQRQLPPPRTSFAGIVGKEPYPVTKKAAQVLQKLLLRGVSRFRQLLQGSRSRSEIVATFLAVLELCRTRKVDIEDENGEPSIRLVEPPAEGG